MLMKENRELINYKRSYRKEDRVFWLVDPDCDRDRELVTCIVIQSRRQLEKLYSCFEENNFNFTNFNLDQIEKMKPADRDIYLKLRLFSRCNGVHLAFRPTFDDIFRLISICPKLKVIFISTSYVNQIGNDCYNFIVNSTKCRLEVISLYGYRSDKSADFKIEIYSKI